MAMDQIGNLAAQAMGNLTVSPPRSDNSLVTKPEIRMPRTIDEANALKGWADAQVSDNVPATPRQLAKHIAFIEATLPGKGVDGVSGQLRTTVYASLLAEYSNEALAFMARRVCATLKWFPVPSECIEILREYRAPQSEKDRALSLCHRFAQRRFEGFIRSLEDATATAGEINEVPDQWRRIAIERCLLRAMPDGAFVIRDRGKRSAPPEDA